MLIIFQIHFSFTNRFLFVGMSLKDFVFNLLYTDVISAHNSTFTTLFKLTDNTKTAIYQFYLSYTIKVYMPMHLKTRGYNNYENNP